MEKLNLWELKGAPLSIILAIIMSGNRSVSVSWLVTETGYSDKTVNSGLDLLRSRQIITQTGRCRYQLTGENVQLPLYWGEKVEPANPSPASDQPALFDLPGGGENFSGRNFDLEISGQSHKGTVPGKSGKIPETGKIPELEMRVSALEKRVSELENRRNSGNSCQRSVISGQKTGNFPEISGQWSVANGQESGNSPKTGEIPGESGEFPYDDLISSSSINPDKEINNDDDESGNFPEIGEIPEDYRDRFIETYDYFQRAKNNYDVDSALKLTDDEMGKLIALHADMKLVDFVMTAASNFDVAYKWLQYDYATAKRELCAQFGIYKTIQQKIAEDKSISLSEIEYHYWNWRLKESDNPKITLGSIITRIVNHFDVMKARESWPLACGYLE